MGRMRVPVWALPALATTVVAAGCPGKSKTEKDCEVACENLVSCHYLYSDDLSRCEDSCVQAVKEGWGDDALCSARAAGCDEVLQCLGGECPCDSDVDCSPGCACDPECNGCACDVTYGCDSNCPCDPDCGQNPVCGNGSCEPGENRSNCPEDCGQNPVCGNGSCEPGESESNCPQDCHSGPVCGNGTCEFGENHDNCAEDCPITVGCGNGTCEPGFRESYLNCPEDCNVSYCQTTGFGGCHCNDCEGNPSYLSCIAVSQDTTCQALGLRYCWRPKSSDNSEAICTDQCNTDADCGSGQCYLDDSLNTKYCIGYK